MDFVASALQSTTKMLADKAPTAGDEDFQLFGPLSKGLRLKLRAFWHVDQLAIHRKAVIIERDDIVWQPRQIGAAQKVAQHRAGAGRIEVRSTFLRNHVASVDGAEIDAESRDA
jgi:hypothetical protein